MNLPAIHLREAVVDAAERELARYLIDTRMEYADKFIAYAVLLHSIALTTKIGPLQGRAMELLDYLLKLREKHQLTAGETVALVAHELAEDAKYIIRWERHGRTDKPGGLI